MEQKIAWQQAIACNDLQQAYGLCHHVGDAPIQNIEQSLVQTAWDIAHLADSAVAREFGRVYLATGIRAYGCDPGVVLQALEGRQGDTASLLRATCTVTGVVLSGGRSTRMGQEKGQLVYQGQTLVARAKDLMAGFAVGMLSQRADQGAVAPLETVVDVAPDCGPMGGIVSTLGCIHTPYALYIPCDMPLLTPEVLHTLLLTEVGDCLCCTVEGRVCTFPLLLNVWRMGQGLEEAFSRGEFALYRLLKGQADPRWLAADHLAEALRNVNTPQAFGALQS